MDFDPPPSDSGDVAPEFFLTEQPFGDEAEPETEREAETETESRDEAEAEADTSYELVPPKKLRNRGESGVPDEKFEPRTQEAKALIIPDGLE